MKSLLAAAISLSVLLLLPGAAQAGRAARDLALERTGVIIKHDYRKLPPVGPNGEMGPNRKDGSTFSLAHQQYGDLYVRAGIIRDDPLLIEQGLEAFDYAFSRQLADGSFPDAEQAEEYAFFVEAVAHSVFLLRETPYGKRYRRRLSSHVRRLEAAVPHVVAGQAWADFRYRNQFYTHSAYVMGSALTLTGALAKRRDITRYGRSAIRMGLSRQLEDGTNPELGGYDVRYQMAGLVYAERFPVYFPKSKLAPSVSYMVRRGLRWMAPRIDPDGWINWYGSTRACLEVSATTGRVKTPGYAFSVRGFAYWGALKDKPALIAKARAAHRYAKFAQDLCGPKETTSQAAAAGKTSGGAETVRSKLAGDRYE